MKLSNYGRILCFALLTLWGSSSLAQTVIGFVTDGPEARSRTSIPISVLEQEIRSLVGDEFTVLLPEDKRLDGGWDLEGVRDALRRQLADPEVDILITLGGVSSNEVARMDSPKPVMAAVTADAELVFEPCGLYLRQHRNGLQR